MIKLKYIFSLQFSNENHGLPISDESELIGDVSSSCFIEVEYLIGNEVDESEPQAKTLSIQEYKELMQLIPQVEKLKNTVKRMESVIKSKDSKLKTLQSIHKDGKCVDLSKLSNVSIFY